MRICFPQNPQNKLEYLHAIFCLFEVVLVKVAAKLYIMVIIILILKKKPSAVSWTQVTRFIKPLHSSIWSRFIRRDKR